MLMLSIAGGQETSLSRPAFALRDVSAQLRRWLAGRRHEDELGAVSVRGAPEYETELRHLQRG